ncbi:MAG TPA: hypothetical protein VIN40_09995, partial [Candidatus Tyrphobacter sp.]
PQRRDPMSIVYIAFGAVVVIIILVFALINFQQQRAVAVATATATPGPNASARPIQLVDGVGVGTPTFPDPLRVNPRDGSPVDGITCLAGEQVTLHIHAHLALFVNGKQLQIPAHVGLAPVPPQGCLYWIHTHDASGIIHIESPQVDAPNGGPFTLGMFFDIWGQPLVRDDVAGRRGPVTAYVNGALWTGDLRAIPLSAHQEVTLEIGKLVSPPNYLFPLGV